MPTTPDYLSNQDLYSAAQRLGTARGYADLGYAAPRPAVGPQATEDDYFSPIADLDPLAGAGRRATARAALPVDPFEQQYKSVKAQRQHLLDQEALYAHRLKDFDAGEGAGLKVAKDPATGMKTAVGFRDESGPIRDAQGNLLKLLGDNAGEAALNPNAIGPRERALRQTRQRLVDEHNRIRQARESFDERTFRPLTDRRAGMVTGAGGLPGASVPDFLSGGGGNVAGLDFVEGFNQDGATRDALGLTQRAPGSVGAGNFTAPGDAESPPTPTPQPNRRAEVPDYLGDTTEEDAIMGALGMGPRTNARPAPGTALAREAVSGLGGIAKGIDVAGSRVPASPFVLGDTPTTAQFDEFDRLRAEEQARAARPASEQLADVQSRPGYQFGKALQDAAREVYQLSPEQENEFFTKAGGMAGGFLPLMASGPAAPATIALQTVGDETERIYKDQIAKGQKPDDAAQFAIDRATLSGTLQGTLFELLPKPLRQATDRLIVDRLANRFLANRIAQTAEGAVLGGGTTAASNVVADRPASEGVAESALGLGIVQGLTPRGGPARPDAEPTPGASERPTEPISPGFEPPLRPDETYRQPREDVPPPALDETFRTTPEAEPTAPTSETAPVAAEPAGKPLPPDWLVTVQEPQGDIPGFTQVDRLNPDGTNAGSTSLDALRAEGYAVPDITELRQGQYRAGDIAAPRADEPTTATLPSETSTSEITGEQKDGPKSKQRVDETNLEPERGLNPDAGQRPGPGESAILGPDGPSGSEQPRGGAPAGELADAGSPRAVDLGQPGDPSRPLTDEPSAPAPESDAVGIRNASVEDQRKALGMDPAELRESIRNQDALDAAMATRMRDPGAGRALISEFEANPRALTAEENALLATELNRIRVERDAARDAAEQAVAIGDEAGLDSAKRRIEELRGEFARAGAVADATGTKQSDALRTRQIMLNEDYSLAELERQQSIANRGEPITEKQQAEIESLHAEYQAKVKALEAENAKHQERVATLEAEKAVQSILQATAPERRARAARPPAARSATLERLSTMADEARERLAKRGGFLASAVGDEGPQRRSLAADLQDISIIAADLLAKGAVKAAEISERLVRDFGDKIRPHLPEILEGVRRVSETLGSDEGPAARRRTIVEAMKQQAAEGATVSDLSRYARKLAEQHAIEGITAREPLVDAVHASLREVFPEVTRREAMDAMSGYGQYSELSKEPIKVTLRDINGQLQNLAKLEDMQAGKAPAKTGVERRQPSDEERRLIRQVNEAKKRGGFTVQDPERQLRTTQDAIKTRLRNEIADLDFQIATGEKIVRDRTAPQYDAEATALRQRRDELKALYDQKFPKAPLTEAERNQRAIEAADAQIAALEQQLSSGDVGTGIAAPRPTPSPELAARQARLEALRTEREILRDTDQLIAQQRSEAQLTREADSLREQIAKKEAALAAGDVDTKGRKVARPADPRLEQLIQQREAANQRLREARAAKNEAASGYQSRELRRLNEQIADREAKLRAGDLSSNASAPRANRPLPPELEQARQKLEAVNRQIADARSAAKPRRTREEIAQASYRAALERRRADLLEREARQLRGDFTVPQRREPIPLSPENLAARAEVQQAKDRIDARQRAEEARNRSLPRKALDAVKEVANTPRALLSSWDLSAVLRQGGFIGLGNPAKAIRAMGPMLRALKSEKVAHTVEQEIQSRPNAPRYQSSKLYFAPLDEAKLSAKEEQIMSNLAEKIPLVGRGVRASNRAFITFLNRLRADSFDAMVAGLEGPDHAKLAKSELDAIANYINVATGRGNLGRLAGAAEPLATIFFSPRLVASRFQLLAGQPLYGGTARTRRAIAAEYGKYLGAVAGLLGLGAIAGASVELDPRSSDFGKLKIGNTRVDFLAGLAQTATFVSRLLTRQTKDSRGAIQDLAFSEDSKRSPMQTTLPQVVGNFARSKLAPVPGTALDLLAGKNVVGEPTTPLSAAQNLAIPLTFRDAEKILKDNGVAGGAGIELLNLLGAGVNNYETHPGSDPRANRIVIDRGLKFPNAGSFVSPDPRKPYTKEQTDAYHKAFEEILARSLIRDEARIRTARPEVAKAHVAALAEQARAQAKAQASRGR